MDRCDFCNVPTAVVYPIRHPADRCCRWTDENEDIFPKWRRDEAARLGVSVMDVPPVRFFRVCKQCAERERR